MCSRSCIPLVSRQFSTQACGYRAEVFGGACGARRSRTQFICTREAALGLGRRELNRCPSKSRRGSLTVPRLRLRDHVKGGRLDQAGMSPMRARASGCKRADRVITNAGELETPARMSPDESAAAIEAMVPRSGRRQGWRTDARGGVKHRTSIDPAHFRRFPRVSVDLELAGTGIRRTGLLPYHVGL
jgi:hypothetical protein